MYTPPLSSTAFPPQALRGNINVGHQTTLGQILASSSIFISGSRTSWAQVSARLRPTLHRIVDGTATAGQAINFAMFSLFPPTFKNRENGMRVDTAKMGIPNIEWRFGKQ
ncbi:uncharacterized protein EV420DRAFT_1099892 [Desarmillaria tabescens]|uniref:Uncharacterized protein n=1 Tax=Armillaria tabescens TaxID=1929756 RepID=A0AA39TLX4_ARMTA|nr:uncharacterized protein EV420DRAFT_1099892 [Desarmillaria tabescens]KAK0463632.1 hypothetical protein EV420DRAFT_1099892 [Desarmillaria tabescens]